MVYMPLVPLSLSFIVLICGNFFMSYCIFFVCCSFLNILSRQADRKELDDSVKLQRLQYLLFKILPVLRHIHQEQKSEVEMEAKLRGNISCYMIQ